MIFTARKKLSGILGPMAVACLMVAAFSIHAYGELPAPLKTTNNKELGTFLTDQRGNTLYTFEMDKEPGKSACYGKCVKYWPPFTPVTADPKTAAPLSIISRDDGARQYAYKGKPLYYYSKDRKPGDTAGNGAGDTWFVAEP